METHTNTFTLYCYKAHFTAGEIQILSVHDFIGLSVAWYIFKLSFVWVQSAFLPGAWPVSLTVKWDVLPPDASGYIMEKTQGNQTSLPIRDWHRILPLWPSQLHQVTILPWNGHKGHEGGIGCRMEGVSMEKAPGCGGQRHSPLKMALIFRLQPCSLIPLPPLLPSLPAPGDSNFSCRLDVRQGEAQWSWVWWTHCIHRGVSICALQGHVDTPPSRYWSIQDVFCTYTWYVHI